MLKETRICFTKIRVPDISGNFGIKLGKDAWETIPADFSVRITFPSKRSKLPVARPVHQRSIILIFFLSTPVSHGILFSVAHNLE